MGMIGTFESFTTARLGIYAAHKGLSVTGNNISNLNTAGYTRQVIDQVSFKAGANDMYRSMMDNHVGSGALVTSISQIRDPYLDIRYRNTNSDVGYKDAMLQGLQQIKAILDEVGKGEDTNNNEVGDGLLFAQLADLHKSLEQLSLSPTKDNDNLARESAKALAGLFNFYAGKLENLQKETELSFQQNLDEVNDILINIRELNKSIRTAEINGDKALEMRDERNRQIDKLSEFMHIKVEYSMEDVGAGIEVEKLTISLGNSNDDRNVHTDESMLVDGLYAAQLSVPDTIPRVNPNFGKDGDKYMYLKPDGTGTNKPEDAEQCTNNIYGIQIGKLLNKKGEEWTDTTVTWSDNPDDVAGGTIATKAVYQIKVNSTADWKDGDAFSIAGNDTPFTIKDDGTGDLTSAQANDPIQLAQFIAQHMTSADYNITAKNDGTLIFTAKKAGAVGEGDDFSGPSKAPDITFTAGTGIDGKVTFSPAAETTKGLETKAPAENPDPVIDPETGIETRVEYRLINNKWYKMTAVTEHTHEVALDDNDLHGKLQAIRELLTEKGEFATQGDGLTDADGNPVDSDMALDENAAEKRGIPYYRMSFDLLARQIATHFNSLNQGHMVNQDGDYIDANGQPLTLNGANISKTNGLTDDQKDYLIGLGYFKKDNDGNWVADVDDWLDKNGGVKPEGSGNLFSNSNDSDDPSNITARTLSVSHSWYTGDVKIVPTHVQLFGADGEPIKNSTQADNIDHMISLDEQSLLYDPRDLDPNAVGKKLFVGSFDNMFNTMNTTLGGDQRTLNNLLKADYTSLVDIDSSRDGVSGVDLNDETMNMMMYQKAYSAACRMMTVIDEVIERLINNTGVAGR